MKVLFAVNLTEPTEVVRKVEDLCERMGADLYVLHVRAQAVADLARLGDSGLLELYAEVPGDDDVDGDRLPNERRPALDEFVRRHFRRPVKTMLFEGPDVPTTVSETVVRIGAEMLVIGQRPHALFERMVVGSVSDKLLRSVDVPTLLIPIRS